MSSILTSSKSYFGLPAFLLVAVATMLSAQIQQPSAPAQLKGVPWDWSHHHLIFSAPKDASQAEELEQEPRYLHQQSQRNAGAKGVMDLSAMPAASDQLDQAAGVTNADGSIPGSMSEIRDALQAKKKQKAGLWGESLGGSAATVGPGNYPAKFSFSTTGTPTTANCAGGSAPDYVVFNTSVAGSSTQASIVAYDNLYSGTCAGSLPQTYWAYNTSGTISRSVVLSSTGSKVAFIQSNGTTASLVVLTPSATTGSFTGQTTNSTSVTNVSAACSSLTTGSPIYGSGIPQGATIAGCSGTAPHSVVTLSAAATNAATETLTYSNATVSAPASCTSPCSSSSVTFGNGKNDSNSSPFYDYSHDILYVGDDSGNLHKFTTVFSGTPTETTSGGWPIAVSSNILTSPVYDPTSTDVFVADSGGFLYSYTTTGTPTLDGKSGQLAASGSKGIVDSPIIDSSAGTVYVFVGDDENTPTNHLCDNSTGCDGVFQFVITTFNSAATNSAACSSTNGTSWSSGTNCGTESVFGVGTSTTTLYAGSFDNAYYSGSGNMWTCAATGTPAPKLSATPVTTSGISASGNNLVLATNIVNPLASAAATCSPVTEIYNGSTDYIYLSVTANGNQTSQCTGACLYSFEVASTGTSATISAGRAAAGGASGMIIDNTGTGGGSQIYFTYLSSATSSITCPSPSGASSGGCAVQASQSALK